MINFTILADVCLWPNIINEKQINNNKDLIKEFDINLDR